MAMLFVFSSWPAPPALPGNTDKGVHGFLYVGLCVVVMRAVVRADWRAVSASRGAQAAILSIAYGVTDEIHQMFVPGRSAEVADLAADAAGVVAAAVALWLWSRMNRRHAL